MSAQPEINSPSRFDSVKLVFAAAIVAAGIYGFYYFADQSQLYRVLGILVIGFIALGVVLTTHQGQDAWGFVKDARMEVRKVVWPSRQETIQTTMIVMVMVFIVGVILWLLDMFLLWGVRLLTGQGS
ncbi:MAG: preprotein translocase subunit SecE [Methylococcales bacterium]